MTTFLLFISITLNLLAFLAIVILFLRQNRFLQAEKKQEKMHREMEELISAYLMEMKEENEKFIQKVSEMKQSGSIGPGYETTEALTGDILPSENKQKTNPQGKDQTISIGKTIAFQAVKAYQRQKEDGVIPPEEMEEDTVSFQQIPAGTKVQDEASVLENASVNNTIDPYMESTIEHVLHLKNQGLSIEEVARRLNKGKTEIELLLKFRQNL